MTVSKSLQKSGISSSRMGKTLGDLDFPYTEGELVQALAAVPTVLDGA